MSRLFAFVRLSELLPSPEAKDMSDVLRLEEETSDLSLKLRDALRFAMVDRNMPHK